jgi:hypothetical protein
MTQAVIIKLYLIALHDDSNFKVCTANSAQSLRHLVGKARRHSWRVQRLFASRQDLKGSTDSQGFMDKVVGRIAVRKKQEFGFKYKPRVT